MLYDLSQPHFHGAPQFPGQPSNSLEYQQLQPVDAAAEQRLQRITLPASVAAQVELMRGPA